MPLAMMVVARLLCVGRGLRRGPCTWRRWHRVAPRHRRSGAFPPTAPPATATFARCVGGRRRRRRCWLGRGGARPFRCGRWSGT